MVTGQPGLGTSPHHPTPSAPQTLHTRVVSTKCRRYAPLKSISVLS